MMRIANQPFPGSLQYQGVHYTGPARFIGRHLVLAHGYVTEGRMEDLVAAVLEDSPEAVSSFTGEHRVLAYDPHAARVTAVTDHFGQGHLFVYQDADRFMFSDAFWPAVSFASPAEGDIDRRAIVETILLILPLEGRTLVRGLRSLPCASFVRCHLGGPKIRVEYDRHWRFHCEKPYATVRQGIEDMHQGLDRAFEWIAKAHPGARFIVGLSGGLDSRIVPHYAQRHGLDCCSYILGERHPVSPSRLSRDHANARGIASHFGLEHVEVEYDAESFATKLDRDILRNPAGNAQLFKVADQGLPAYDVMLNAGGHGTFVDISPDIDSPGFSLPEHICNRLTRLHAYSLDPEVWSPLAGPEDVAAGRELIARMVAGVNGSSPRERYQDFHISHLAPWCRYGAFESQLGRTPAYSIYYPFLFRTMLKVPVPLLTGRVLLNAFVQAKLPARMSSIPYQDAKPPVALRDGLLRTLANRFYAWQHRRMGAGVMRYGLWASRPNFLAFAENILNHGESAFWELFDRDGMRRLFAKPYFAHSRCDLLKQKRLVDIIASGAYRELAQRHDENQGGL